MFMGRPITERRINYSVKAAAKRAGINPATSAHWLRHVHASHAIDGGAPITDAHAKPNDSSRRYLNLPACG